VQRRPPVIPLDSDQRAAGAPSRFAT
jgi:hypothetical protein